MRIFVFKSEKRKGLRAFTGEGGGKGLPTRHGPWAAIGVVRPEVDPPHGLSRATIEKSIGDQGFQLFKLSPMVRKAS
jgi:hypothetical protein